MIKLNKNNIHNRQSGFTLLEVLITLVILAVGLLGLAGLQATSLTNNHSAYQRSQATQLAYDIIDRMRANVVSINNYLADPALATVKGACTAGGCSTADMAENDLFEWNTALTSALPSSTGAITFANPIYTVAITWDDTHSGNLTLNMSFQP